jgi:hypothetical protein
MHALAQRVLSHKRKRLFGSKAVFCPYQATSEAELVEIEARVNARLPNDLKAWLLTVGFGDLDEDLSFRAEWFKQVENGALRGAVLFAQDILGNFFAFVPSTGRIVFFSRSAPEYAVLANSFGAFMEELERRDFKTMQWVESVACEPYAWDA